MEFHISNKTHPTFLCEMQHPAKEMVTKRCYQGKVWWFFSQVPTWPYDNRTAKSDVRFSGNTSEKMNIITFKRVFFKLKAPAMLTRLQLDLIKLGSKVDKKEKPTLDHRNSWKNQQQFGHHRQKRLQDIAITHPRKYWASNNDLFEWLQHSQASWTTDKIGNGCEIRNCQSQQQIWW